MGRSLRAGAIHASDRASTPSKAAAHRPMSRNRQGRPRRPRRSASPRTGAGVRRSPLSPDRCDPIRCSALRAVRDTRGEVVCACRQLRRRDMAAPSGIDPWRCRKMHGTRWRRVQGVGTEVPPTTGAMPGASAFFSASMSPPLRRSHVHAAGFGAGTWRRHRGSAHGAVGKCTARDGGECKASGLKSLPQEAPCRALGLSLASASSPGDHRQLNATRDPGASRGA